MNYQWKNYHQKESNSDFRKKTIDIVTNPVFSAITNANMGNTQKVTYQLSHIDNKSHLF